MSKENKQVFSGIGGQAVMEGIMMRSKDSYAVAVRKPDGEIEVMEGEAARFSDKHPWAAWPFVRGVFSFVDSIRLGIKTLMWSASFELEEDEKKDDGEKQEAGKKQASDAGEKKKDSGLSDAGVAVTVLISFAVAVGMFSLLPAFIASLLSKVIQSHFVIALLEGLIRLAIFVGYVAAISLMKDIRRVYMYHGSEHKCINCLEHGLPLTVENVMASSKEHKRCGTSFLLLVMLISVILFMFIRVDTLGMRFLTRILLIPVIASLSFELLTFTGKHDNKLTYILSRPGMWMQALTTKEPEPEMCEVAIQAVEKVFDWQAFLEENFKETGSDAVSGA